MTKRLEHVMSWIKLYKELRGGTEYKADLVCTSKIDASDHVTLRSDSPDPTKMPPEPTG
jgi:hypothetical protein